MIRQLWSLRILHPGMLFTMVVVSGLLAWTGTETETSVRAELLSTSRGRGIGNSLGTLYCIDWNGIPWCTVPGALCDVCQYATYVSINPNPVGGYAYKGVNGTACSTMWTGTCSPTLDCLSSAVIGLCGAPGIIIQAQ
jgi:hypothetical protein